MREDKKENLYHIITLGGEFIMEKKDDQMKLMSIAGARPNFMKIASIADAIDHYNTTRPSYFTETIEHILVHTGQHYDEKMSKSFFDDLGIPKPDFNLEVGSASHAQQTAEIMKRFERVLLEKVPDVLLVVGDVNSTIACVLVAAKITYPEIHRLRRPIIVHVEAGLRSFDNKMPEEINRILTDAVSDMLFVTEKSGVDNLGKEGCSSEKIHFVGNVMIDTLMYHLERARQSEVIEELGISAPYGLITLHRPSNVDNPAVLQQLVDCFVTIAKDLNLVFPVHPRTRNNLAEFRLLEVLEQCDRITLLPPLRYFDFLAMIDKAELLLTDSGGIQEETTYLGVPCITLRENTERPVTVEEGTNYLIGTEPQKILETYSLIRRGDGKDASVPQLWDGKAGKRIIEILVREYQQKLMT